MNRNQAIERIRDMMNSDLELIESKNSSYAENANEDFFDNFKKVEALGITDLKTGILVRCSDKISRMINLIKNPVVGDTSESIHDTIRDLTNYLFILRLSLKFDVNFKSEKYDMKNLSEAVNKAKKHIPEDY